MGMRHDMLQYKQNQAKVLQNIAIQQCASLGLCQTEVFTSAGVHQQPRRKPMSGIAIPVNSAAIVDLSKNNSMKAVDMDECGPMGYIRPKHLQAPTSVNRCVLDRGVAMILYLIKTQADEGDGACVNLYGAPAFSTHGLLEEQNGDLSYEYDNREIVSRIQVYMNGFILLESVEKSSRSPMLGISQDTRTLQDISTKIHRCASDLHDFIEQQPQLYPNKKASGLYVMLDFGTYEIPMLWWLKFALSKRVFLTRDTAPTAFSTHGLVEENNGDLFYEYANRDIVRRIQVYMNGFILLESVEKSSRSPLLVMSPDSRGLQDISTKIHKCASDLHDFIEQQQQLYPNKKASGLHVMLDFGTYEIPMFWWMQFALSKRVFMTRDASSTAISVQALNGDLPLPLNSFTH